MTIPPQADDYWIQRPATLADPEREPQRCQLAPGCKDRAQYVVGWTQEGEERGSVEHRRLCCYVHALHFCSRRSLRMPEHQRGGRSEHGDAV